MKVFTNTTFTGHYPVGAAAVVTAQDQDTAAKLLNEQLLEDGLKGDVLAENMIEVQQNIGQARILVNGDY